MLRSDEIVVGVYAAPAEGGPEVASAAVRAVWSAGGGPGRGTVTCLVLGVRRESGPDFVRRFGEEVDYPGAPLGAARRVHGVVDVSDPVGGEYLMRSISRDRRLRRLTAVGKLVVPGAVELADGKREHPEAFRVSRAALFLPFSELVAAHRVEIGRDSGAPAVLRELAGQLKAATARRPDGNEERREDLARALALAVWYVDAHDAARSGGVVAIGRA
jgi:hypothetical protein